jgi:mRNA interferase MazF
MAITFHPKPGQILLCDFSQGFKEPEMVKNKRPVIVLTGVIKGRANLVTITPLSIAEPIQLQSYHYKVPKQSMPMLGIFQTQDSWVKGDMIYTVGFHRLDQVRLGKRTPSGKREYYTQKLGKDQMKQIYQCVLHGLNLGQLGRHL